MADVAAVSDIRFGWLRESDLRVAIRRAATPLRPQPLETSSTCDMAALSALSARSAMAAVSAVAAKSARFSLSALAAM